MRKFIAALALMTALPAHAQDAATAAALRDKALSDPTAFAVAASLTTEIGPRLVGSPGMARAKDWAAAKFAELGFTNVKVEEFPKPAWVRGPESAEIVAPYPMKLAVIGLGRSVPTPAKGIEAEVAVFPTYAALLAAPAGSLSGKIAVVTEAMVRTQDASGYVAGGVIRRNGPSEAARRGAVGYLMRSLSTDDTRLPHTGALSYADDAPKIPAAALSPPDAEQLERLASLGPVKVRLNLASSVDDKAVAWNISGEIVGSETPQEVIVIGGHLDSWDPGTGAVDDAAGIAITTAAARLIGELPRHPRRTVRVVMFGSEETGGSESAYAKAREGEIADIVVASESDLGSGRAWALRLPKGSRDHPAMKAAAEALAPLGVIMLRDPATFGGSDIEGLQGAGVPVFNVRQDASRYFDLHHSADDTLDKIDPAELNQNVAAWAALVYLIADSDIDFRSLAQ